MLNDKIFIFLTYIYPGFLSKDIFTVSSANTALLIAS